MTGTATAALFVTACAATGVTSGCGQRALQEARARTVELEQALRPTFFATALRKMGGGHFHGTTRFAVTAPGEAPDPVTTTTDVWIDRVGSYRMTELNDHDGGRDVVLYGRELTVALRYGKMIRRVAEEPEPTRLLEEALGAPWAGWEVIAGAAAIERGAPQLIGGASAIEYRLSKGDGQAPPPATTKERPPLRKWRGTVAVQTLSGSLLVDERSGALVKADLQATFMLTQETRALQGEIEVHSVVSEAAAVPAIERPAAEAMALRQRLVPEQKELLSGLGGRVPPPIPPQPVVKKKKGARP